MRNSMRQKSMYMMILIIIIVTIQPIAANVEMLAIAADGEDVK